MLRVSIWMVHMALLYLGLGFSFGALMLWNKGLPIHPALWRLLPIHIEFLLLGWTLQLAMGIAIWILPRLTYSPHYGDLSLAWGAFFSLNAGVLMVTLGNWRTDSGQLWIGLGRLLELIAATLFVFQLWRRVKPLSVAPRPRNSDRLVMDVRE